MIRLFFRAVIGAPGFAWRATSALFGRHSALLTASLWLLFAPLLLLNARLLWLNRAELRSVARLLAARLRKSRLPRRLAQWGRRTRGAPLSGGWRPWSLSLADLAETLGAAAVDTVARATATKKVARDGSAAWAHPAARTGVEERVVGKGLGPPPLKLLMQAQAASDATRAGDVLQPAQIEAAVE